MKELEFNNLTLSSGLLGSIYIINNVDMLICADFILYYFNFDSEKCLPLRIKKLTITRSERGFVVLRKTIDSIKWFTPKDVKSEEFLTNTISHFSDHTIFSTLNKELKKLFKAKEAEIKVDVYIEYEEEV
jgi:hypothetical protein